MGEASAPASRLAVWLAGAALAIATLNSWLAFGRPIYLRWRDPQTKFRNLSGLPVIGNLLAVGASIAGFGTIGPPVAALLAVVLDIGGLPWFVVLTWRDKTLWNPR